MIETDSQQTELYKALTSLITATEWLTYSCEGGLPPTSASLDNALAAIAKAKAAL